MFLRNLFLTLPLGFLLITTPAFAQISIDKVASPASAGLNRRRGQDMLEQLKATLKKYYYDKNFRGIDVDAKFKQASEKIKKLDTNSQIFRVIAALLLEFDDSHTMFYPPGRANAVEYGFSMQMIGPRCVVVDVKKGSDAEAKGLKVGDVIVGVGDFNTTRENLWKMEYAYYTLSPQANIKVAVLNPDGTEKELDIKATFKSIKEREKEQEKRSKEKREDPFVCKHLDNQAIACRLKTFVVEKSHIDKMMKQVAQNQKFILDLRGNGGGYVHIEEYLVGHFFDRNVKIADFITRDKKKERIAKPQKDKIFKGDLFVLIDSDSASASEIFARVIQLEKRGKIVGDVSAGAVMTSYGITMANERGVVSNDFPFFGSTLEMTGNVSLTISIFGMNVTVADLLMSDGNRLEKIGVIPDHPAAPTGAALLNRMDPVLAYAASLAGAKLTAEEAGKFNFIRKKEENEKEETPKVKEGEGEEN